MDERIKKWGVLAATVLLALNALGIKLGFMDTNLLGTGFIVKQLIAVIALIGVYMILDKNLSLR